jgi:hypothetical protein
MLADSPAWAAVYGVAGVHNRCFRGPSPLTGKISGAHLRSAEHLALQGALDHPGPPSTDQADTDKVTPINNITSGHHRLIIPLKSDMATDPLLPVIRRYCRQLDTADRSPVAGKY